MRKTASAAAAMLVALSLAGCGMFDKEYVQIDDYVPAQQAAAESDERVKVRNFSALKQAIRTLVSDGESTGKIVFDSTYDGDAAEDMASACWQVRTQDALCAYCVNNISYELSKIVTYYEANVEVSYAASAEKTENIIRLPYSTGLEKLIDSALSEGKTKLVVLINQSAMSAEDMEGTAKTVYEQNPASAPKAPYVSVNMYSGTNNQKLYEINIRYGMSADELAAKKAQLDAVRPFEALNIEELDEGERALAAYEYLLENCAISGEGLGGSIYSALVEGTTDSEGAALAYVELCRQLSVDCRIVYGQRNWEEHCWNIIRVNGAYYHVDVGLSSASAETDFLNTDQSLWESYRWDTASYPACTGTLTYGDMIASEEETGQTAES